MSFSASLSFLRLHANNRGKDADSFGSCIDGAAKVLPRPKPGNAGCRGHLPRNLQHIPKAVVVKAAHGGEVVGEGFGVSGLQLLNQELDVGGDEFLFGGGLLAVDGGDGGLGVLLMVASPCRLLLLHVRVETRHVHAERHLAKAGVASVKGRGISHPWRGSRRRNGKGGAQRRSAQAKRGRLGRPLDARDRGRAP